MTKFKGSNIVSKVQLNNKLVSKPILKWAGGKAQMLDILTPMIPPKYNKYIEPFFGGGALFFALNPCENSIIADSNIELINLYKTIANDVESVIEALQEYKNDKDFFYNIRSMSFNNLSSIDAAARTIYLNRTGFNGLYRVNKKGQFNVPFGKYVNPDFIRADKLRVASNRLKKANIVCGDYKKVLYEYASEGDFIFLDPPYLPVSKYSDFRRYTKEQFYEEDQIELSNEVKRLNDMGCHVILTNSNHPMIHELYKDFEIEVHQTRRNINSKGSKRRGEDIVVQAKPHQLKKMKFDLVPEPLSAQIKKYPTTRYMGSKNKLLAHIRDVIRQFECETVLDLFSGSGVVSYMLKSEGKHVISNDYMALGSCFTKAMVENNNVTLDLQDAKKLLLPSEDSDMFVQKTFEGLYFSNAENELIDNIRANIKHMKSKYKRSIALSALIRACMKKRPRGIFTYTGYRYDDGRKDLKISFEEHFLNAVELINNAVFDNHKVNISKRGDALRNRMSADLVYMDPPYYSPHSDNEYVRRYHFVEGIACDWKGVDMQWHTKTKKFKNYPTPFSSRIGAHDAFDKLFKKHKKSVLVVSYSSNSLPTLDEMVSLMSKYKNKVEVLSLDHRYSIGNQKQKVDDNMNQVKEYLFIGY